MTAIGKYNVSTNNTANTLFVVGDGTSEADTDRSDAFRVVNGGSDTTNQIPSSAQAKVNGISDVYLGCPIGTIVMWAGTTAPYGWHICDGQGIPTNSNYSEVEMEIWKDYSNLLKVLAESGYPYGNGSGTYTRIDGSTASGPHVNLPNFQQRFPLGALQGGTIGINNSANRNGWSTNIGSGSNSVAGEATHILTWKEMKGHSHPEQTASTLSGAFNAGNNLVIGTPDTSGNNTSEPHNNIPPFLAINFIIKYK